MLSPTKDDNSSSISDNDNNAEKEALQYPLPPIELYSKYTEENVTNGLAPLSPKPPQCGYSCFGVEINPNEDILQPLEQQGIINLANIDQNLNSKQIMLKITDTLVATYLQLLEALSTLKPRSVIDELINRIETLFINFHNLINKQRIHQFYESSRQYLYQSYQKDATTTHEIDRIVTDICDIFKEINQNIKKITANQINNKIESTQQD